MNLISGEHERALDDFSRAFRLNPIDPILVPNLCWGNATVYWFTKRHEDAIAWAEKVLVHRPKDFYRLFSLATNARLAGHTEKFHATVQRIHDLFPNLKSSQLKARHMLYPMFRRQEDQAMFFEVLIALD